MELTEIPILKKFSKFVNGTEPSNCFEVTATPVPETEFHFCLNFYRSTTYLSTTMYFVLLNPTVDTEITPRSEFKKITVQ